MRVGIFIGDQRLDLFEDESIILNSSVADVEDVSKNTTDYTQSFTVPATENNNRIFKHYYNADITNGFDARVKVAGKIEIDGILFKYGKFLLTNVKRRNRKPLHYSLNFWGNLVDLKDLFGNDELKDLDLSAFNHEYNSNNVKIGLSASGLFSGDIKYALLAKRRYYYNKDTSDTTNTEQISNIAWHGSNDGNGIAWNDLSPSIRISKIIDAIQTKYDITFTDGHFGTDEFNQIYMWLNNSKERFFGGGGLTIDWDSGSSEFINFATNIGSYEIYSISGTGWQKYDFNVRIFPEPAYMTVPYTVVIYEDGEERTRRENIVGQNTWVQHVVHLTQNGGPFTRQIRAEVVCGQEFSFTAQCHQVRHRNSSPKYKVDTFSSVQIIESNLEIKEIIPKIKVIDFIKGIFQAFKMVIIPTSQDGDFYVDTVNNYYASGEVLDLTKYIDWSEDVIERGKLYHEINYNFEDPTTILNMEFKKNTGIAYGDEEAEIRDDEGELLDGDTLEVKIPFESIIYERLTDQNDNIDTRIMYAPVLEEDGVSPANPKPHLHYIVDDVNISNVGKDICFINDIGNEEQLQGRVNMPSHTLSFTDKSEALLFGAEYSEWDGSLIDENLYTNYHKEYIDAIFSKQRRQFVYDIKKLPLAILMKLTLNDIIRIKNSLFRINYFEYDLVKETCQLNLVNGFNLVISIPDDIAIEDDLGGGDTSKILRPSVRGISTGYDISIRSFRVTNLQLVSYTITKVEDTTGGAGTDWATVTVVGDRVNLEVQARASGEPERRMYIQVQNDEPNMAWNVFQVELLQIDINDFLDDLPSL